MPLYCLLVGRRIESVLGVHAHQRDLTVRSLDVYAHCPCDTTMLYLIDMIIVTTLYTPARELVENPDMRGKLLEVREPDTALTQNHDH